MFQFGPQNIFFILDIAQLELSGGRAHRIKTNNNVQPIFLKMKKIVSVAKRNIHIFSKGL